MRTTMRTDLTAALKARDKIAATALRSALAAIENAEAVPTDAPAMTGGSEVFAGAHIGLGAAEAERRVLTEADVRAIVEGEIRDRTDAADEYQQLGRTDAAERLRGEAEVLGRYL
ncbi:hypothetical protein D5S17_22630 [Pseudonocardiaceae bacterium YIM PH 21723]|nr:hypothetical protein D5S17_22630 [Pseudonocardiaceae bacterium YIM PH 21723]